MSVVGEISIKNLNYFTKIFAARCYFII